jgi:hypothetical protein
MAESLRERLQAIADSRGVRDPMFVNSWSEHNHAPHGLAAYPSHEIAPTYHRADGKPRLKTQLGDRTATQAYKEQWAGTKAAKELK